MLQCELCNYFKREKGRRAGCACEFTGLAFRSMKELERDEYPCAKMSYDQYLQRLEKEKASRKLAEAI